MRSIKAENSIKSIISVQSIELPDTPNELLDDRIGKRSGSRINFTKTFMQFMCPSCCGGLFSEPKGSVYTKRKPTKTDTIRSESTTVSLEDADKSRAEVFSEFVDVHRQMATVSPIPEEYEGNRSPEQRVVGDTSPSANHHVSRTTAEDLHVQERSHTEVTSAKPAKERKLQRDQTIREELHMYSKELTERVNRELAEETEHHEPKWGNILRKTSYPNAEAVTEDTVVELKIAGRDHVEVRKQNGASEAPFDFQAFLRKTNTTRQSVRRFSDIAVTFADGTHVIAELLPNVVLEGTVYNM